MKYLFAAALVAAITLQDCIAWGYLAMLLISAGILWMLSTLPASIRARRA